MSTTIVNLSALKINKTANSNPNYEPSIASSSGTKNSTCSSKKLNNIQDAVFRNVVPKPPDFDLHEWEKPITQQTKLYYGAALRDRTVIYMSKPTPSMLTVQGLLKNFYFTNHELFNIVEPTGLIRRIKSGPKFKNQPGFIYDEADDETVGFNSQITFWIDRRPFTGEVEKIFKIKIFNHVGGVGKVQIPGIKDINCVINILRYLKEFINNQLGYIENVDTWLQEAVKHNSTTKSTLEQLQKLIYLYTCDSPLIEEPSSKDVYELGGGRKCIFRVPVGKLINFDNLNAIILEIYKEQRKSTQARFVENFNLLQLQNKKSRTPFDCHIMKRIYSLVRNPLHDIIWPIAGPPEDNKGQKKAAFYIFNPRYGNDEKKYTQVVFNSVPKGDVHWEYSILMTGAADERHINYMHQYIWELLNCYQRQIFYDRGTSLLTDENLELCRQVLKLEQELFE